MADFEQAANRRPGAPPSETLAPSERFVWPGPGEGPVPFHRPRRHVQCQHDGIRPLLLAVAAQHDERVGYQGIRSSAETLPEFPVGIGGLDVKSGQATEDDQLVSNRKAARRARRPPRRLAAHAAPTGAPFRTWPAEEPDNGGPPHGGLPSRHKPAIRGRTAILPARAPVPGLTSPRLQRSAISSDGPGARLLASPPGDRCSERGRADPEESARRARTHSGSSPGSGKFRRARPSRCRSYPR